MKIDLTRRENIETCLICFTLLNGFSTRTGMKYENLIEYYADDNKYYPTSEYEETSSAHAFIDEYKNAILSR